MLILGVLCLAAAVLLAAGGVLTVTRPHGDDPRSKARVGLVPPQFASAVMFAAAGALALTGGMHSLLLVLMAIVVATGTVAAGAWRAGRSAVEEANAEPVGCAGSCSTCTQSCPD